jgi:acetyl-CoA carboxylase biotin carboxyl carrier protein
MTGPIDLPLTAEDVQEIVATLRGSGFRGLDLTTTRFTLRVARGEGVDDNWTQEWSHSGGPAELAPTMAAAGEAPESAEEDAGVVPIKAPLPGSFYHAPQPGADPFVSLGQVVTPDTIVGIIETMKVMNSVAAGVAGEVVEIVAANGAMLEGDAVLFRVRVAE